MKIVAIFIQLGHSSYIAVSVPDTYINCPFINSSSDLPFRRRNREITNTLTIAKSKKLLMVINTDS